MSAADLLDWLLTLARWGVFAAAVLFILGTILAESDLPHWPVRLWDFPRLQVAILMLGLAILYPLLVWWAGGGNGFGGWWNWVVPLALLAATIRQAMWIWPYVGPAQTRLLDASDDRNRDGDLSIVISNVLMENEQYGLWRDVVTAADPDVLLCAETTQQWIDEIDLAFDKSHPHRQTIPQDNCYGMALWSRLPLKDVEVDHIVQGDIPSIHVMVTLKDGRDVRLHCLHPRPPAPQMHDSSSPRDAELILVARRIDQHSDESQSRPTLVIGDLNDVAWSRTTDLFLRISGLLDPRRGRGFFNSFHAEHWWMRFPLDHVFVSDDFRLVEMRRLAYVGSDHFPMFISVSLEPEKAHEQDTHSADAKDRQDAQELVEEQIEREDEGEEKGHLSDLPEEQLKPPEAVRS